MIVKCKAGSMEHFTIVRRKTSGFGPLASTKIIIKYKASKKIATKILVSKGMSCLYLNDHWRFYFRRWTQFRDRWTLNSDGTIYNMVRIPLKSIELKVLLVQLLHLSMSALATWSPISYYWPFIFNSGTFLISMQSNSLQQLEKTSLVKLLHLSMRAALGYVTSIIIDQWF